MLPGIYLLILLTQAEGPPPPLPGAPLDEVRVTTAADRLELNWTDAEDRLQGAVTPRVPKAGQTLTVTAHVGTFAGPDEWDGPLTFTLKAPGQGPGQSVTVPRGKGEKTWAARLTPAESGEHVLEVAFQTSRHKVVRAKLTVAEGPLSRWPWFALVGAAALVALIFGVRAALAQRGAT